MDPGGVEPPSLACSKISGGGQINRYPMDP